jgi:hypothetical protein
LGRVQIDQRHVEEAVGDLIARADRVGHAGDDEPVLPEQGLEPLDDGGLPVDDQDFPRRPFVGFLTHWDCPYERLGKSRGNVKKSERAGPRLPGPALKPGVPDAEYTPG